MQLLVDVPQNPALVSALVAVLGIPTREPNDLASWDLSDPLAAETALNVFIKERDAMRARKEDGTWFPYTVTIAGTGRAFLDHEWKVIGRDPLAPHIARMSRPSAVWFVDLTAAGTVTVR